MDIQRTDVAQMGDTPRGMNDALPLEHGEKPGAILLQGAHERSGSDLPTEDRQQQKGRNPHPSRAGEKPPAVISHHESSQAAIDICGAAARTSASTWFSKRLKFSLNMSTRRFAVCAKAALSCQVLTG